MRYAVGCSDCVNILIRCIEVSKEFFFVLSILFAFVLEAHIYPLHYVLNMVVSFGRIGFERRRKTPIGIFFHQNKPFINLCLFLNVM